MSSLIVGYSYGNHSSSYSLKSPYNSIAPFSFIDEPQPNFLLIFFYASFISRPNNNNI